MEFSIEIKVVIIQISQFRKLEVLLRGDYIQRIVHKWLPTDKIKKKRVVHLGPGRKIVNWRINIWGSRDAKNR